MSDHSKKPITWADVKAFFGREYVRWTARAIGAVLVFAGGWAWREWDKKTSAIEAATTGVSDLRRDFAGMREDQQEMKKDIKSIYNAMIRRSASRPLTIDPYIVGNVTDGGRDQ